MSRLYLDCVYEGKQYILDDKQLIKACIKGDNKAQRMLYEAYGPKLMGLCLRYVPHREDAEEVFHDAMIKIFSNLSQFKAESSLKTWMGRIGINLAIDFLRKKKNLLFIEHIAGELPEMIEEEIEEPEFLNPETALQILNQLPHNLSLMINMFTIDGLSHAEIGDKLGISAEASRTRLKRAKTALAEITKKEILKHEKQSNGTL